MALALLSSIQANTIWPKPQSQQESGVHYTLDPVAFRFKASGAGAGSDVLKDAFKRYRGIIFQHSASANALAMEGDAISSATVNVASADESLTLETNQAYNLTVGSEISIEANTVYGALNGLESPSQLVNRGTFIDGTKVVDCPRYQFRATMIDTSRHYFPLEVILHHIDAMA